MQTRTHTQSRNMWMRLFLEADSLHFSTTINGWKKEGRNRMRGGGNEPSDDWTFRRTSAKIHHQLHNFLLHLLLFETEHCVVWTDSKSVDFMFALACKSASVALKQKENLFKKASIEVLGIVYIVVFGPNISNYKESTYNSLWTLFSTIDSIKHKQDTSNTCHFWNILNHISGNCVRWTCT